ncbi:hypothetical protein Bbelb_353530 [Branchiostoma belcheri]|nr:hypothetical protein Bbelb_353530 [Branchiostoma belcheri]
MHRSKEATPCAEQQPAAHDDMTGTTTYNPTQTDCFAQLGKPPRESVCGVVVRYSLDGRWGIRAALELYPSLASAPVLDLAKQPERRTALPLYDLQNLGRHGDPNSGEESFGMYGWKEKPREEFSGLRSVTCTGKLGYRLISRNPSVKKKSRLQTSGDNIASTRHYYGLMQYAHMSPMHPLIQEQRTSEKAAECVWGGGAWKSVAAVKRQIYDRERFCLVRVTSGHATASDYPPLMTGNYATIAVGFPAKSRVYDNSGHIYLDTGEAETEYAEFSRRNLDVSPTVVKPAMYNTTDRHNSEHIDETMACPRGYFISKQVLRWQDVIGLIRLTRRSRWVILVSTRLTTASAVLYKPEAHSDPIEDTLALLTLPTHKTAWNRFDF